MQQLAIVSLSYSKQIRLIENLYKIQIAHVISFMRRDHKELLDLLELMENLETMATRVTLDGLDYLGFPDLRYVFVHHFSIIADCKFLCKKKILWLSVLHSTSKV